MTVHACCKAHTHSVNEPTLYEHLLDTAIKVSVVTLGVIGALSSFPTFMVTFSIGMVLGALQGWNHHPKPKVLSSGKVCGQGFIEEGTGVSLPPFAQLAINVALIAEHLVGHHQSTVHILMIGLYLGTWLGNEITPSVKQWILA